MGTTQISVACNNTKPGPFGPGLVASYFHLTVEFGNQFICSVVVLLSARLNDIPAHLCKPAQADWFVSGLLTPASQLA
jgi:hypothetical protein